MPGDRFTPDELEQLVMSGEMKTADLHVLHPDDAKVALKFFLQRNDPDPNEGTMHDDPDNFETLGEPAVVPGMSGLLKMAGQATSGLGNLGSRAIGSLPYVGAAAGAAVKHPFMGYRAGQAVRDFFRRGATNAKPDPKNLLRTESASSQMERVSQGAKVDPANLSRGRSAEVRLKDVKGTSRGKETVREADKGVSVEQPSPSNLQRGRSAEERSRVARPRNIERVRSAADEEAALGPSASETARRRVYHEAGGAQSKGVQVEGRRTVRRRRPK